jgi:hypothetical protein
MVDELSVVELTIWPIDKGLDTKWVVKGGGRSKKAGGYINSLSETASCLA